MDKFLPKHARIAHLRDVAIFGETANYRKKAIDTLISHGPEGIEAFNEVLDSIGATDALKIYCLRKIKENDLLQRP